MKKEKRTRSAKRDPAFIAIQRWHRNWEKYCRFLDSQGVKINKKRKAALDRQVRAAYRQLTRTTPTTIEGAAAMLVWFEGDLGDAAAEPLYNPLPAVIRGLTKIAGRPEP